MKNKTMVVSECVLNPGEAVMFTAAYYDKKPMEYYGATWLVASIDAQGVSRYVNRLLRLALSDEQLAST